MVAPLFKLWDQFLSSKLSRQIIYNLNFNNAHWLSCLTKVNVKNFSKNTIVFLSLASEPYSLAETLANVV